MFKKVCIIGCGLIGSSIARVIRKKNLSSKIKACIVKNNKYANIRKKNTTKSKKIYKADYGVAFKVIKKKGDWLKIKHANGKTGWIHKSLVWGNF